MMRESMNGQDQGNGNGNQKTGGKKGGGKGKGKDTGKNAVTGGKANKGKGSGKGPKESDAPGWPCPNPDCSTHLSVPSQLNFADRKTCFKCGKDWHYTPPRSKVWPKVAKTEAASDEEEDWEPANGKKKKKKKLKAKKAVEEVEESSEEEEVEMEVTEVKPFPAMMLKHGIRQIPEGIVVIGLPKPSARAQMKTIKEVVSSSCVAAEGLATAHVTLEKHTQRVIDMEAHGPAYVKAAKEELAATKKEIKALSDKRGTPSAAKRRLKDAMDAEEKAFSLKVATNAKLSERGTSAVSAALLAVEEEILKLQNFRDLVKAEAQANGLLFSERAAAEAKRHADLMDLYKSRISASGTTTEPGAESASLAPCANVSDPHRNKCCEYKQSEFPVFKVITDTQREFLHQLETTNDFFRDQQISTGVVTENSYHSFFGGHDEAFTLGCILALRELLGEPIWKRMYGDHAAVPSDALPNAFATKAIPACLVRLDTLLEPADDKAMEVVQKKKEATAARLTDEKKKKTTGGVMKGHTKA